MFCHENVPAIDGEVFHSHLLRFRLFEAPAQNASISDPVLNQQSFANFASGEVNFLYGSPVNSGNLKVEDNPFFKNGWMTGVVIFRNGKRYAGEIRLDLVKNELQFRNGDRPNIFADPVAAFSITDSTETNPTTYYFQSGYPAVGMQSGNTFYLLLNAGKNIHLLKYLSKKVVQIYQYNTSAKSEYKNTGDWWIYSPEKNKMKFTNSRPASLRKSLKPYGSMVDQYVGERGKKELSDEEMIALAGKVNTVKKL